MTNLILSSNFSDNKLYGVGEAVLQDGTITIIAELGTEVTLLRGVNKVVLLKASDQKQKTSGRAILDDVYTLENNSPEGEVKRLSIKVESELVRHETNLFVNSEPLIDATSTKRKTTLTVGVLILALLIISVVFGIKQKNLKEFNTKSEEKLSIAITNYELQTREAFVLAKETVEELKQTGYKSEKLEELLKKISENEEELLGEIKPEVKELLDLTLQINGFNGNKLSSTGEIIFVFDEKEKNIIQTDINGKSTKISAKKEEVKETKQIASYEDKLFLDKLDGVYEVNSDSLFYSYAGNIYILNKSDNTLKRHSGAGDAFGEGTDWLAPGIEADFSKVIDMTIDGSIWVLSSSGKVTRFTNGNPASISLNGIVSPFTNPTAIYTNEVNKNVYILDKDNGRVVVLEKNGDFKVQYISDQIKNATDLVVSEKEGKVILLTGSKLIYFEPK